MSLNTPTDKLIRKLRKKLREIERLEILGRPSLNEEEIKKVKQKQTIRQELAQILKQEEHKHKPLVDHKIESSVTSDFRLVKGNTENGPTVMENLTENSQNNESQSSLKINSAEKDGKLIDKVETLSLTGVTKNQNSENKMKRSSPVQAATSSDAETPEKIQKMKQSAEQILKPKMQSKKPSSPVTKAWHEIPFLIKNLEVHSDIISCVDMDDDYIISGSRDTLVQVWDVKSGLPLVDLRGHSNTITCAQLLSAEQSQNLGSLLNGAISENSSLRLALTGSSDCCLKLWNIQSGVALRSIYTYSGITALRYLPALQYCIIGSEGGKLEIYTFQDEEQIAPLYSIKTFEGPVSAISFHDDLLICSSLEGLISVWTINGPELSRLFLSESLISDSGQDICNRPVLSLSCVPDGTIVYGDEGTSIKVLSWKNGQVKKLRNHTHEFGLTNAVVTTKSFLLSSSINLDTGNSTINVRSLPDLNYLGTLSVRGVGRIACLAAVEDPKQNLRIVTGGTKLMVLETGSTKNTCFKDHTVIPIVIDGLNLSAGDSDNTDTSSSSDEEESSNHDEEDTVVTSAKNTSWCHIL